MEKRKFPEKCEICLGLLQDPKLLPCFHVACRDCVRNLFVKGKKEIKCPVEMCRKGISCKDNNPESLPDALSIYHKRDVQRLKSRVESHDVICELCIDAGRGDCPAEAFCNQCSYICAACSRHHETEVQYSDHNVASFLELSHEGDDFHYNVLRRARSTSENTKRSHKLFCEHHPQNEKRSYCLDCQVPVCSICIDRSHSTHSYRALEIAAMECRDRIKENLPSISSSAQTAEEALVLVNSRKAAIENQRDDLATSIDDSFTRMTKILLNRQKALHQRLMALTDSKLRKLDDQKNALEGAAGEMRRRECVTTELLRTSTEHEILTKFQFLENVENLSDRVELVPCQIPNLAFKQYIRKEFTDLCGCLEICQEQADVTKCTLVGGANLTAQTMHYSTLDLLVHDKEDRPCTSPQNVNVRIKCCKNDFECSVQVHHRGTGPYSVLFYPEFRGKHTISVTINNRPMASSPFTLKVCASIARLGFPDQPCFENVKLGPRGIALTPDGGLLTCQWNGSNILKLGSYGDLLKEVDIRYRRLTSLVLNSSGHVFVVAADEEKSGIIKCNQDGQILNEILYRNGDANGFKSPRGVAVCPKGNVYVCDRDNHRIQIYDNNLNLVNTFRLSFLRDQKFVVKKEPLPNDIAFDHSGRMFIVDYSNHCVHVFDVDRYCFSFSRVQGEVMGRPECIAIGSDGLIFVSDSDKNCVSVFQSNGEWVKTLGKEGSGDGELKFPTGLAVDEYGTLFVCDFFNSRIQLF